MIKKTMLFALTAASAALFALPSVASAQEIHIEGISSFSGTGGAGSFVAEGEPTITYESIHIQNGVVDAGGTTGSLTFDITGCHVTVFGFTAKCHTSGSPLDNTISTSASFHVITYNGHPAILLTPATEVIISAGISNFHVEGNGLIGTITSPACGETSSSISISFSATGPVQNHISYTGVNYDLKTKTGTSGTQRTTGVNGNWTLSSEPATLNCT